MKKIKVERFGIVHYVAFCDQCDFQASAYDDNEYNAERVRNKTRWHVEKTGHSVTIESGSTTVYSKEK